MIDKRDIILDCGVSNPDAVLNALHQGGWKVVPKDEDEIERLRTALLLARDELGVPDTGYPVPVANAHDIITDALAKEERRP